MHLGPAQCLPNPLNPPYQGDLGKGTRRGKPLALEGWDVCKDLMGNAYAKDREFPMNLGRKVNHNDLTKSNRI